MTKPKVNKIPVAKMKRIAEAHDLSHIILFATQTNGVQHVVTYGRTVEQCSEAADFGNLMKEKLGWPKSLTAQPSRVKKLEKTIKHLQEALNRAGSQ